MNLFGRPMEETLILSGWKDDSFFYGQSDAYMTLLMTARERNLLKQHERAARGFAFPEALILDEETENENFGWGSDEEDMLLPNRATDSIAGLPSYLWSMLLCSVVPPATALELSLSKRSRDKRTDKAKDILCDFVFVRRDDTRLFFRSMSRAWDPLLGPGNVEPQHFLDYLPMLRSISVQERFSEAIHNAAQHENPAAHRRHQRTTRQTSKRGHVHYLESLVPPQTWRGSDQTAKQVGDYLADTSLLYDRPSGE